MSAKPHTYLYCTPVGRTGVAQVSHPDTPTHVTRLNVGRSQYVPPYNDCVYIYIQSPSKTSSILLPFLNTWQTKRILTFWVLNVQTWSRWFAGNGTSSPCLYPNGWEALGHTNCIQMFYNCSYTTNIHNSLCLGKRGQWSVMNDDMTIVNVWKQWEWHDGNNDVKNLGGERRKRRGALRSWGTTPRGPVR